MPVVGSIDQHDVELLFLQHLPIILPGLRLLSRRLSPRNDLGRFGHHLAIDIAKPDNLHRSNLYQSQQVDLAIPASPDQADSRNRCDRSRKRPMT